MLIYSGAAERQATTGGSVLPAMLSAESDHDIIFGPFRLDAVHRKIFCGTDEMRLGDRAMDVLLALARHKGEIVSKERLFAAAWPDIFVQDANLKVTISYLRRAFRARAPAADYIKNVIGRGYWLDVDAPCDPGHVEALRANAAPIPDLPDIVGRSSEIAEIERALAEHRLVSVVGAGGIGKTTVARAAARHVHMANGIAVTFVDFSRITSDDYVASSLASALGISSGQDSLQAIASILARERMLLVFDTCEHVLSAVIHICDVILAKTRNIRILATSRQLLRARGEKVIWLGPLAMPAPDERADAREMLRFPALRLLALRAAESGYLANEEDAPAMAEICRRLDGLPLAIELVAPRLAASGPAAVIEALASLLLVLKGNRGQGPQRQQSLPLTLQWSYSLLTAEERAVLRAVSVFAGSFNVGAAVRVATREGIAPVDIVDAMSGLRAKSMVSLQHRGGELSYRLLDSTRAFARELLDNAGEAAATCERHARLCLEQIKALSSAWNGRPAEDRHAAAAGVVDELRSAVDWSLARSGNPAVGIELVAAGLPLWHEFSPSEEVRQNCERALSEFERIGSSDFRLKLQLLAGLARVSTYLSPDSDQATALFRTAAAVARQIGDAAAECRILGALTTFELLPGRGGSVAETLDEMRGVASSTGDRTALWEEQQLRTQWEIRICEFGAALARAEALFAEIQDDVEEKAPRFQIHQKMNIEVQLAALNWLKGRPGEAVRIARIAARDAELADHGMTLIHCLAQGIVWTLFQCGDYAGVRPYVDKLRSAIYRHGIAAWLPVADCYDATIAAMAGERPDPQKLRDVYLTLRYGMVQFRHDARFAMCAEAMLANGQPADAARVVADIFQISADPWGKPEFLRIRAAAERAQGRDGTARTTLEEALRLARKIGCLPWELRAAHDLARLLCDRDELSAAKRLLGRVCERFGDGFETSDTAKARLLLAALS